MAQQAQSIYINDTERAELLKLYGSVIENLQKKLISGSIKSQNYSGDPRAGSIEFKRFVNSKSQAYGTARAAQKGENVKAPTVTVKLDTHREIVEEVNQSDVDKFGVAHFIKRRQNNHIKSMERELERAFFSEAVSAGTLFTTSSTGELKILEEMFLKLEKTENDFVDGVDRSLMTAVVSTDFYSKIRDKLDELPTFKTDTTTENFEIYRGVRVRPSIFLPAGTKVSLQVDESIAMPVSSYPYEAERIPLSNDVAIELFYDYGCEALAPDLILNY